MIAGAPSAPLAYGEVIERLRQRMASRRRVALDDVPDLTASAVAVVIADRGGLPHIPLIVRPADAPTHSGQIALPGGRVEPQDTSRAATAVRETFEELGIDPARLDVLGELDDVPTPTGFVITPVIAAIGAEPIEYRPSPREVAAMFEAPLQLFVDRSAAELMGEREWRGNRYQLRAYLFGEHRIWGATARILESLMDVLALPDPVLVEGR
jgi:8-oxo-dGTP pyrophosphatase MutT (NUDIX family)